MNYDSFLVKQISRDIGKPFVEKHHYIHTIGKTSLITGLFNNNELVGVITFGQVSGRLLAQSIFNGGTQYNTFELLRMCVKDECKYPRTQFISKSISLVRQLFPQIKCIVSFADYTVGHVGTVYQAASFIYTGQTSKKYHYIKNGIRYNKRIIWDNAKKTGMREIEYYRLNGYEKVTELPKLRYIFPLRKINLKLKSLQYIKR